MSKAMVKVVLPWVRLKRFLVVLPFIINQLIALGQ
jgi:hypothetical protein